MSDAEDKINDAPEEVRPALMNLDHRITRLESVIDGDERAGIDGIGCTMSELKAQLTDVKRKIDTFFAKLSVIVVIVGIIFPIVAKYVEKMIGI